MSQIEYSDVKTLEVPEKYYEELYSKADILYFKIEEDCAIISCNVTAQEKLSFESDEWVGKSFLDWVAPMDYEMAQKSINLAFRRGYVKNARMNLLSSDGVDLHVHMNALVYEDSVDGSRFLRVYMTDQTLLHQHQFYHQFLIHFLDFINQAKDFSHNKALLSFFKNAFRCQGVGLCMRLKNGETKILGEWPDLQENNPLGAKDFRCWHQEIWSLMIQKCLKMGLGHTSENGSFWISSIEQVVSELHDQKETNIFISLQKFESLCLVPLGLHEKSKGYLIFLDWTKGRWNEYDVQFFETVNSILNRLINTANTIPQAVPDQSLSQDVYALLDMPFIGIMITRQGIVQRINPWMESILDAGSDAVAGKSIYELAPIDQHKTLEDILAKPILRGQFLNVDELMVKISGETAIPLECAVTSIPLGDAPIELWYCVEKKDMNRILKELQQYKRMEALGLLTGGIVHDFNNLLSTILGYSTVLKEEIPKSDAHFSEILEIYKTSEKAVELTSRLLAYAHGKSYVVDNLNINQLVAEVAGILSRTLDKNIMIRADQEENLFKITADAGLIQQAIFQVALNAKEAMPHGGSITFQTRNLTLKEDTPVLKAGCEPGNYIQLTISDTGLGMTNEVKEQIFHPQFTTKEEKPGRGLGLKMVEEIVSQYGGFVSVFSEIGKGTVFKVYLPANFSNIRPAAKKKLPRRLSAQETVLILDREPNTMEEARQMLLKSGYFVLSARNERDAVQLFKKHMKKFHLVLFDLLMPGSNQQKMMTWLKKVNPEVKVIALLQQDEKKKVPGAYADDVAEIIRKPVNTSLLLKRIDTLLH